MREATKLNALSLIGVTGLILVGAPLAGVWLAGQPIGPYLELPPRPVHVEVSGFSWAAFWLMAAFIVAAVAPFVWRFIRTTPIRTTPFPTFPLRGKEPMLKDFPRQRGKEPMLKDFPRQRGKELLVTFPAMGKEFSAQRHQFPVWGWAALLWLAASWTLAWVRFSWFETFQSHTFTPLWLGYVAVVNAFTVCRAGSSLLTREPMRFAVLFPLSALFWWFFEYLNRFVGNWHYAGIEDFGAIEYTFFATLAFSTVLPAVASTAELVGTFQRLDAAFARWLPIRIPHPRLAAAFVLVATTLSLAGLGAFREYLYPLVWISPVLVIISLQVLSGRVTALSPLARGDWRGVVSYAAAALLCGFFWEMWNYGSFAHWEYSIPYVDRFRIFEMPLLGYAGYLPFGIECAAIAALVLDRELMKPQINTD